MLYAIWESAPRRPTRDVDFLGFGDPTPASVEQMIRDVVTTAVEPDGLAFDLASIRAERIRGTQTYHGVRVRLTARLAGARIPLQVDVGFGDAVVPDPQLVHYPAMLEFEAPRLRAYAPEPVVAEKLHALVTLGMANSRMKDFYDLWAISDRLRFEGRVLRRSIEATFDRRRTQLTSSTPLALTSEFSGDRTKQTQWRVFLTRSGLVAPDLIVVVDRLARFLVPPARSIVEDTPFGLIWLPGGPWTAAP